MTDRACRRIALALLGAILALGAVLFPTGTGASTPAAHVAAAVHGATAKPFPPTAARPATPMAKAAHVAYRVLGYADPAAGPPPSLAPLLTMLGLGLTVAVSGRSRLSHDRRRPRGPPVPVTAA